MKLSDLDLDLRLPKPPMILVSVLAIGAFIPLGLGSWVWYDRNDFQDKPRVHIFQDMDNQAKKKAQSASDVFADGRAMRHYAPGTVAWGRTVKGPDPTMLKDDDLAYRGYEVDPESGEIVTVAAGEGDAQPKYLAGFPETIEVNYDFMRQGRDQYMIHCYTCHGADGMGLGPTKRAMDVWAAYDVNAEPNKKSGTVSLIPANLQDLSRFGEPVYANGRVFNTITMGQGTMAGLGDQIKVKDRWAIIAYLRAMQSAYEKNQVQEASEQSEAQDAQTQASAAKAD